MEAEWRYTQRKCLVRAIQTGPGKSMEWRLEAKRPEELDCGHWAQRDAVWCWRNPSWVGSTKTLWYCAALPLYVTIAWHGVGGQWSQACFIIVAIINSSWCAVSRLHSMKSVSGTGLIWAHILKTAGVGSREEENVLSSRQQFLCSFSNPIPHSLSSPLFPFKGVPHSLLLPRLVWSGEDIASQQGGAGLLVTHCPLGPHTLC